MRPPRRPAPRARDLAVKEGTPIKVVSERLGHSKVSVTLDTYSHALSDWQNAAIAAAEGLLSEEMA